jgi:hypothetical protein
VEADQVDVLTVTVLCDFEEIEYSEKAGGAGELRSDVGEADGIDGVDFDFAFLHGVASADADVRAHPDADRAGDLAAADAIVETPGEEHGGRIAGSNGSKGGGFLVGFYSATKVEAGHKDKAVAVRGKIRGGGWPNSLQSA